MGEASVLSIDHRVIGGSKELAELILSAEKFAAIFNTTVPGASRPITGADVRELSTCGLIGREGYYARTDLETVREILQYEKLRADRLGRRYCKLCGSALPAERKNKVGRKREYCDDCQPRRSAVRVRKWRRKGVSSSCPPLVRCRVSSYVSVGRYDGEDAPFAQAARN